MEKNVAESQAETAPTYVAFDRINLGNETSTRAKLSKDAVARYREHYEAGLGMPPPILFTESEAEFFVGDGRHRITAQIAIDLKGCQCEVRRGSKWDAMAFAAQSNLDSAVPRTVADRGLAVDRMLGDPVRGSWTNAEIARHCGVSDVTVGNHRRKLERTGKVERSRVRTSRSGREIDTGNIGSKKRVAAVPTPKSSESSEPTATSPHTARPSREALSAREETNFATPKTSEWEASDTSPPAIVSATPPTDSPRAVAAGSGTTRDDVSIDSMLGTLEAAGVQSGLARIAELLLVEQANRREIDQLRQQVESSEKERESFGVLLHELGVSSVEAALQVVMELKSHAA